MAGTALPGRLTWRVATVTARRAETPTAATLVLSVPGWPGHLAGQHVDLRLTAEDGYSTQRSYSLAAPADGDLVELTLQRVEGGEVSPYLTQIVQAGDLLEIRGPVGGWFVWRPSGAQPVLLVAGGSGIVPLMAMIRAGHQAGAATSFRLVYSVRAPEQVFYVEELRRLGPQIALLYTRDTPVGEPRPAGRLAEDDLTAHGWPPASEPACYVCGPTGFVEHAADLLVGLGHDPARIKTERFGPTGG